MLDLASIAAILTLLMGAFGIGRVTKRTGAVSSVLKSNDTFAEEYNEAIETMRDVQKTNRKLLVKIDELENKLDDAERNNHKLASQLGRANKMNQQLSEQLKDSQEEQSKTRSQVATLAALIHRAGELPEHIVEAAAAIIQDTDDE